MNLLPSSPFQQKSRTIYIPCLPFLTFHSLLNPLQSNCCLHLSTEIAFASVSRDFHIVTSNDSCLVLTLFSLLAAFRTVDHSILLETLFSLGFWETTLHLPHWPPLLLFFGQIFFIFLTLNIAELRDSVFKSLLFSFVTHFLGNFIQSRGFKYQLYADGAQIYSAFYFMRSIPFLSAFFPLWEKCNQYLYVYILH